MRPICTHTISLQSSKPSHAYPIIRLPREFKSLAGAKGTILQTIYKGALAFLVVIDQCHLKENGVDRIRNGAKTKKYEPLHGEDRARGLSWAAVSRVMDIPYNTLLAARRAEKE